MVTIPLIRSGRQVDGLGLSAHAPGGYAEQVVVQESLTLPVPNGLHPDVAALTHAVNRAEATRKDTSSGDAYVSSLIGEAGAVAGGDQQHGGVPGRVPRHSGAL
ncbi:hypothetical protein [Streptomyces sp. NPDC095817]|uniref:hypothetical protein n=1 Tax=Streptomyces sp. NPDC095817 TaxID=3155082 RepID=UPI0033210693